MKLRFEYCAAKVSQHHMPHYQVVRVRQLKRRSNEKDSVPICGCLSLDMVSLHSFLEVVLACLIFLKSRPKCFSMNSCFTKRSTPSSSRDWQQALYHCKVYLNCLKYRLNPFLGISPPVCLINFEYSGFVP